MQKLKNSIIDKMLRCHLTRAEVDFILELSHYQDERGKVYGVYYKDICTAIDISYDTFYVTIDSLVQKGILRKERSSYGDFDLSILENDFTVPSSLCEGYISTGHYIFFDKDFQALKAGEKLLALKILMVAGASNSDRYSIAIERFFKKYAELLGVTKRTIRTYLTKLRKFFTITVNSKFYLFQPKERCFAEKTKYIMPSDGERFAEQLTRTACRRNRTTYTERQYQDTRNLIRQYAPKWKQNIANVFLNAVKRSIQKANDTITNQYKWNRQLNPKLINKLISQKNHL